MIKFKFFNAFVIALILFQAVLPIPALAMASTSTNQLDYAPGGVVTISGDSSDGFVAGENVHVDVSGPDGASLSCDATADDSGAWSCQVSLPSDAAGGDYSYTATGETSGASTSGSFTVTVPPPPTVEPTQEPTQEPTVEPTQEPTQVPTVEPTESPTVEPTLSPTVEPTSQPTDEPTATQTPTEEPRLDPTDTPTPTPAGPVLTPFITSDKDDYAPGEKVTLTSGDWQPGESVHLIVNDALGDSWRLSEDVQANGSGGFTYQFNLPDWFVAQYHVYAFGSISGSTTWDFTDSVTSVTMTAPTSGSPVTITSLPATVTFSFSYVTSPTGTTTGQADVLGTAVSNTKNLTPGTGSDSIVVTIPAGTANGTYNVKVTVTNNTGSGSNNKNDNQNGAIIINVPTNTAPVANNDSYSTNEDTTLNVAAPGVLGNDTDAQSNPLTAVLVSGPSHGTLTLNANGSFSYTPAANYNGSDSFTYKANDGSLDSNTATVSLTINVVNDAPAANNDSYSTNEDTALTVAAPGVLSNDTDVEGSSLTAALVAGPAHGTLTLNSNGSFTYTPAANYNGPDSFTYKASDGSANSNVATVNLTINAVNDAPVAVGDSYSTNEDTALNVALPGVLGNDSDADGNSLTAALVAGPAHGTLALNANGSFGYTPAANYDGPDSFTYKANDGSANSNVATVNLTINAVNDAPIAAGDSYNTNEDTALTVAMPGVLGNDTDVESNPLTAVLVTGPAHGTLTLNANGSFSYTPAANYNGSDSFTYKANDGSADSNVATVTITIISVNDAPVAANDSYGTDEDASLIISAPGVLGNDSDVDGDSLTAILVSGPSHGTLTLNANGSFSYTPAANYNGPDSFTYKANDGSLDSNVATVSLTINAVNDAPVAANDSYSTDEDTALIISTPGVLGNDTDVDADDLSAILVAGPVHGTLTLNANGSFSYTPTANYNGPDSFTYKANDGSLDSNVATVSLTINAVNDAPVLDPMGNKTVNEETLLSFTAAASDIDVPADTLTFSLVGAPAGAGIDGSSGDFSWTPTEAQGSGDYTFTVKVCDNGTPSLCDTEEITVQVDEVNVAPVLDPIGNKTVNEETALTFTASASDHDLPANTLTFSLVGAPAGAGINSSSGAFSWTPSEVQGPGDYTFTVKVCDDGTPSLCDDESITVYVNEVNLAPALNAIGDKTVNEETLLSFTASATDADLPANTLTFSLTGEPAGASINGSTGAFSWTPSEAQGPGDYTFTVKVCDNGTPSLCDQEAITVHVDEVNVAPVLDPIGNKTVDEETLLSFAASASDHDLPANTLSFSLVGAPAGASIDGSTGAFSWTPTEAQGPGVYGFDVCVSDGALEDCETMEVTVNEVNVAPVLATIGDKSIAEETELAFTASANDQDIPANTLTFSLVGAPAGASIASSGAFSWTPTEAQGPGTYTFGVCVSDSALSDCENIKVTVSEVNVAPVLSAIGNKSIDEGSLLSFTASASDHDIPANTLTYSLVGAPAGAGINSNSGVFTWTPSEAQGPGTHTFDVCVSDGALNDCETITVTVAEVNVAPVLGAIGSKTVNEGSTLSFTATATDADLPANTLSFSLVGAPSGASINSGSGAFSWIPADNGVFTFAVKVCDNGSPILCDDETITVTVNNVAPIVGTLTLTGASGQACIAGNSVSLSFGFTDAGINDNPWAVDVNWGDGNHTIYNAASQGAQAALTHSYGAGTFTISVKVTDKDGSNGTNASSTGAISHLYNMSGILAPFNPDGTSVWKYGSTLPVKVKITDCNGNPVSGLAPKIGTSLVSSTDPNLTIDETASTSGADTTGVMRYDPTAGQYIYNFASKNLSDPSATYYMTVKGTDASGNIVTSPAMVQVKFGLKTK